MRRGEISGFIKLKKNETSFAFWNISKSVPVVVELHWGFGIMSFLILEVKLSVYFLF